MKLLISILVEIYLIKFHLKINFKNLLIFNIISFSILTMIDYIPIVYSTTLPILVLFSLGALILCYFDKKKSNSIDYFLAAKRTQPFDKLLV